MNSKLLGGILLIVGTSIGGGMLALPVSTAEAGLGNTILFLILCWLTMTAGALLILEVNLRLPAGSNLISMAKSTLGLPGQIVAWITYLILLYALLAAYISGGTDVLGALLQKAHINLPASLVSVLFTCVFSVVVYNGIQLLDYINRGLMFGKLSIYLLLVLIISPYINLPIWHEGSLPAITGSLMILVGSFGFASIVPSLREYFKDDIPSLRKAIVWGSLIPLACYIVWDTVLMGALHREGLLSLLGSDHATSGLTHILNETVQSPWITRFFELFTSICMITAFLAVSLGLFDFLADGLQLRKQGYQGYCTLALTFIPPLAIVLINPGIYLQAFSYAGACCVILLLLMPTLMAWRGRQSDTLQLIPGGNFSLMSLMLIASMLLYLSY